MAKQTKIDFTTAEAQANLQKIKGEYQRIFRRNLNRGMKPTTAAKEAGKEYRKAYGSTPTKRWSTARKAAAKGDKIQLIGLGTFSTAKRK